MLLSVLLLLSISKAAASIDTNQENFLSCLSHQPNNISKLIYTRSNPLYESVLNFTIQNYRFKTPNTPKPILIVTPLEIAHVQNTIKCAKQNDVNIRIRSGGHDFEGLSYVSPSPFIILDLFKFKSINIDVQRKTAWVQSGATIGELYYKIANKSKTLAFPGGICPGVGIGGQFSGGGYGVLMRKYGLAVDNVIDAQIIDVNGRILHRKSMGEDLFWAIRGGGGNSFGVVLSWRINLVVVPSKIALFAVQRNLEQNLTKLIYRWQQIADKFHEDVFSLVQLNSASSSGNRTIQAMFACSFLGEIDGLISIMQQKFPELGVTKQDCIETTWAKSVLFFAGFPGASLDTLLDRTHLPKYSFKAKSDYVKQPIPEFAWQGVWEKLNELEGEKGMIQMVAYGARISEISESATPFPHRAGTIFKMLDIVVWTEEVEAQRHVDWIRRFYRYLAPYVSRNPRLAYVNIRDLDLGTNNIQGNTSYEQASIWGTKYFGKNFERLVRVKTIVDPTNFFRNEQSVPPLTSWKKN